MAFLFFKFNGSKTINLLIFLYNIWLKNPKQFFPTVSHWQCCRAKIEPLRWRLISVICSASFCFRLQLV